ncbi:putative ribonuclease subunit b protein [Eutypa lata UCREL1]|uniref:Putative ribonuclease subunit b protein n=1 Tax=Eutypa lata (strain UCR-EL1) TaxID=1287681 RepID=M7TMF7_EUTLA|nr:putative ribonuclease subunit b protein [Eutypa lata UCREL1]
MADQPLPKSMEEKFVTKVLEAPMLGVKRGATLSMSQDQVETTTQTPESESEPSAAAESSESQSSVSSSESTTAGNISDASTAATAATSVTTTEETKTVASSTTEVVAAAIQASEEVVRLQRLRTAFQFICGSYVAPTQAAVLKEMLLLAGDQKSPVVDFAPLDDYLAQIAKMRQDALATRSMGDYARKRVLDDDEEAERAEKRRKKEEDEKRKKAGESRGVKNLKKVNTSGMKKMSDFFKKK